MEYKRNFAGKEFLKNSIININSINIHNSQLYQQKVIQKCTTSFYRKRVCTIQILDL